MTQWIVGSGVQTLNEYNTIMGNTWCVNVLTKCLFKQRIRCEITNLLYKIIDDNPDTSLALNGCAIDVKHFTNLRNQMAIVRAMSDEWSDVMRMCIDASESVSVTIRKILDLMTQCGSSIRIADILCLCTYVTDLCVALISRNDQTNVCEIIETLVDYIIDKNIVMCVRFLQYIDDV